MILSWNVGLSQDTQIQIQSNIAKLVVTDLIEGDSAKEQIKALAKEADLLMANLIVKDSIIKKNDGIIMNYEEIVGTRDEQLKVASDLSKKLNTDLKKQKAKTKIFQMGTGTAILGVLIISILPNGRN